MRFGPELTPTVRLLIFGNGIGFVVQLLAMGVLRWDGITAWFALHSDLVLSGFLWQMVTYSFLHGDFFHLLINMLTLWMFGSELENTWGKDRFLKFYFFSVFTAALLTVLVHFVGFPQRPVVGASGGIYGLLVGFAMVWPNREILFMFIFPIKAKFFVLILMLLLTFSQNTQVAHLAHLGGALGGFLYYRFFWKTKVEFSLSKFLQKRKMKRYQKEMNQRVFAKDEVDRILDKISKQGMDSLTRTERNFLNEASKKYFND